MSTRTLLITLLATSVVAFAAPGVAGAADICVSVPLGTTCNDHEPDLQTALDVALANSGADTVLVGDAGFAQNGPFLYPSKQAQFPVDPVTIKGVGTSRPRLTAPAGSDVIQGYMVTLDHVDVSMPSSASGVGVHVGYSSLHDVHISGPGGQSGLAEGIRSEAGSLAIDDVQVSGVGRAALHVAAAAGTVTVTRLDTADSAVGMLSDDNVQLRVARSKIRGRQTGLSSRGTTLVESSVIETTAPDGVGISGGDGDVTLDHVTVVHPGPGDGTDAALEFHPVDFGGKADISSVVLAGYTHGFVRDTTDDNNFTFPITVRDSVWDASNDIFVSAPNAGTFSEQGDAHLDPKLVDVAGGDLRLRGSSAAVDRDTQTDLAYKDVTGSGPVDGDANGVARADAGAFEYRREAPSIDSINVPGSGTTGQSLSFSAGASDADGDAVELVWDFGDGGIAAGAQVTHAFASSGIHTVILRATDDAGVAATRSFTVTVGAAPIAASSTTGSGTTSGPTDVTAPRLSDVRLTKKQLSRSRLRGHAAKAAMLRFLLSERAKVRVTVGGVTVVKTLDAGRHSIDLTSALRKVKRLRLGRLTVKVVANDAAGNRSTTRSAALKVVA